MSAIDHLKQVDHLELVAFFGHGSIWNADDQAIYVRGDRNMRYPTFEGQVYLALDGVYVVENGRWVKQEASHEDH